MKLAFYRLMKGPPKPKVKIQNLDNFPPGGLKWDEKCNFNNFVTCSGVSSGRKLNFQALMEKTRNIVYNLLKPKLV
jgi:hypothetical protein